MKIDTKHKLLIAKVHGFLQALLTDEAMQGDLPSSDYWQPGPDKSFADVREADQAKSATVLLVRPAFKKLEELMTELYPEGGGATRS